MDQQTQHGTFKDHMQQVEYHLAEAQRYEPTTQERDTAPEKLERFFTNTGARIQTYLNNFADRFAEKRDGFVQGTWNYVGN